MKFSYSIDNFSSDRLQVIGDGVIDTISYKTFKDAEKNTPKTENEKVKQEPADFETAIGATGFGKFNLIILLIAFPSVVACSFDSTSISFIIPVAHCDLELSLFKKGSLNAIIYFGMITTPFVWGFLADILGRRKMLIWGYTLSAICDIGVVFATNYWVMLILKYLDGCSICGPFAILMSYLSELHGQKHRTKLVLFTGICFSAVNIMLPMIAWAILPKSIEITLIDNQLVLHSWNVFLFVTAFPSMISAMAFIFLPESPKFLMAMGRNDEALRVFKTIYSINTGMSQKSYPVKELRDETEAVISMIASKRESTATVKSLTEDLSSRLANGWQQIKPLFAKPHISKVATVFTIQYVGLMGVNTLRLWLPQLFTMINAFYTKYPDQPGDLCLIIGTNTNATQVIAEHPEDCTLDPLQDSTFHNFIILGAVQGVLYSLAGWIIKPFGKKHLLIMFYLIAGGTGLSIYYADSENYVLITSCIYCGLTSVASTTLIVFALEMVPTTLRAMAVSILMMCGRAGSLSGNLIFPLLLQNGCLPAFVMIGGSALVCSILTSALPKASSSTF